jgi:DNA-binding NtrC family response regulator
MASQEGGHGRTGSRKGNIGQIDAGHLAEHGCAQIVCRRRGAAPYRDDAGGVLFGVIEEGRFRRDLYWRLNVLGLFIPPLRDRRDDIMPLIRHFLGTLSPTGRQTLSFAEDALLFLTQYPWPGNVRELKNLCERLTVVHTGNPVDAVLLSRLMEYYDPARPLRVRPRGREDIERALVQAGGKMSRAAQLLGIHRATLWRKCKRLSLQNDRTGSPEKH